MRFIFAFIACFFLIFPAFSQNCSNIEDIDLDPPEESRSEAEKAYDREFAEKRWINPAFFARGCKEYGKWCDYAAISPDEKPKSSNVRNFTEEEFADMDTCVLYERIILKEPSLDHRFELTRDLRIDRVEKDGTRKTIFSKARQDMLSNDLNIEYNLTALPGKIILFMGDMAKDNARTTYVIDTGGVNDYVVLYRYFYNSAVFMKEGALYGYDDLQCITSDSFAYFHQDFPENCQDDIDKIILLKGPLKGYNMCLPKSPVYRVDFQTKQLVPVSYSGECNALSEVLEGFGGKEVEFLKPEKDNHIPLKLGGFK